MKRHHLLAMALCAASLTAMATETEKLPAFPGAEGFGRYVTGGRGGAVYHVTSLADDGSEGTLRWACSQKGARTIVFDVSGTIHLTSTLALSQGNVTIAGQTAPGDGICVADYPFAIKANNVIVRFMRFRLGNTNVTLDGADGWDGLGAMDQENIMVDHCSVSWSIDECLSIYGVKNSTVQWCIASQSLANAGHSKGAHGYGGNWGGSGMTYHHNLLAHHESRVPRLGPRYTTQLDERMDMRNNVMYNWGGNGCYGGEAMKVNIVNNYYKPGPATAKLSTAKQKRIAAIGVRTEEYVATYKDYAPTKHVWGKFYVDGNKNSKYADVTNDNWTYGMYNQIDASGNDGTYTATTKDTIKIAEPIDFTYVTTHTADDAYDRVLAYAGCSKVRDSHDEMIVSDTRNGVATYTGSGNKPGIINTQNDNKPADAPADWSAWPTLSSTAAPADTDGDGMPDEWETANGLNPNDPTDGAATAANGYTNLENYLNGIVADITTAELEGGTGMGNISYEGDDPVVSVYELSQATSNNDWTFSNGFSISTSKGYAAGSSCGIAGIKFSRNTAFTINIPDGISIGKVEFTGYSNVDDGTAYLSQLGSNTYASTDYVFPSRTGGVSATHSIELATPATKSLAFKVADNQVVFVIKLHTSSTSGIADIADINRRNGAIHTIDGRFVGFNADRLAKGIYIVDGKKVAIK